MSCKILGIICIPEVRSDIVVLPIYIVDLRFVMTKRTSVYKMSMPMPKMMFTPVMAKVAVMMC
jgi:hypothetical protein